MMTTSFNFLVLVALLVSASWTVGQKRLWRKRQTVVGEEEKKGEAETADSCSKSRAAEQYEWCFRNASSPPQTGRSNIITPDQMEDDLIAFCQVKIGDTRHCFQAWLRQSGCPNTQELSIFMVNTGGLCDEEDLPADWMREGILPQLGEWNVGDCGLMDEPLSYCRHEHHIQGWETSSEQMDAIIGCILDNLDLVRQGCDKVVAMYIMMIRMTHFAQFGVMPSCQSLETLKNMNFTELV